MEFVLLSAAVPCSRLLLAVAEFLEPKSGAPLLRDGAQEDCAAQLEAHPTLRGLRIRRHPFLAIGLHQSRYRSLTRACRSSLLVVNLPVLRLSLLTLTSLDGACSDNFVVRAFRAARTALESVAAPVG